VGAVESGVAEQKEPQAFAADAAIVVEGVSKRFGHTVAIEDCSLRVERGEFVSLLGASGCGKTTLLRIIAGFETQDAGTVRIHGRVVDRLPPNRRPANLVFQRYALFPHKTVFDNISFPLELRRVPKLARAERVREMLELVRLPAVEERMPNQLSGGQAQRVALARALIGRPQVLLLDEPLTALDLKLRKAMQLELRRIQEELGTTFLYVTHDQEEALTMSDRIALMNEGRIIQEGDPAEIYERPRTVFASHFIGEANHLHGVVAATECDAIRVRVEGLDVLAPPASVKPGEPVVVSIRPERIELGPQLPEGESHNRFSGQVQRRIFLGHLVRWLVEIAPGIIVTVEGGVDSGAIAEGQGVQVAWRKDASIVLAAS
jgi:spermidine/putrescine transport system ATP-binding protein